MKQVIVALITCLFKDLRRNQDLDKRQSRTGVPDVENIKWLGSYLSLASLSGWPPSVSSSRRLQQTRFSVARASEVFRFIPTAELSVAQPLNSHRNSKKQTLRPRGLPGRAPV